MGHCLALEKIALVKATMLKVSHVNDDFDMSDTCETYHSTELQNVTDLGGHAILPIKTILRKISSLIFEIYCTN